MAEQKTLLRRQLAALCWVSVLSPLFRQAPSALVRLAGRCAWLSVLLSALPLWLLIRFLAAFLRTRREGEGLADQICRALGEGGGRVLLAVYGLWLLFYMGFVLRSGADRFIATVYPNARETPFLLSMAALLLPAGLGRSKVLGRFAQVVQPVLLGIFSLAYLLILPQVRWENLLPVSRRDLLPILRAVAPVVNTLGIAVYAAFLEKDTRIGAVAPPLYAPLGSVLLLLTLLCVTTVGSFGPALTAELNYPFFVMLRNVQSFPLLDRIEPLVIVQWAVSDFVLSALLLRAASSCFTRAFFPADRAAPRTLAVFCLAAAVVAAFLCARTSLDLAVLSRHTVPLGSAIMVFGVLPAAFLVGKARGKL